MVRLLLIFLLLSSACHAQMLPGVVAASKNYQSTQRVYVDIPVVPTFTDTHTLVQATTGTGLQIGDLGGKVEFLVYGNYGFMQFTLHFGGSSLQTMITINTEGR